METAVPVAPFVIASLARAGESALGAWASLSDEALANGPFLGNLLASATFASQCTAGDGEFLPLSGSSRSSGKSWGRVLLIADVVMVHLAKSNVMELCARSVGTKANDDETRLACPAGNTIR